MTDKINKFTCPMCKDAKLEHREHKGTHAYVCPNCPFIGFEYYDKGNLDNLGSIINMEEIEAENYLPTLIMANSL